MTNALYAAGSRRFFCDVIFVLAAAAFAWLAVQGNLLVSGLGAVMDSDLQTYAQGMIAKSHPEMFAADPALSAITPANNIPNAERFMAAFLAPQGQWAIGLIRAGGIAIFLFLCGWYLLGRRLFQAPSAALLLALVSCITVWVGWGTFWGVLHSDPVPRVFFAGALPFLLLFFFYACTRPVFQPVVMFAAGLGMWIHGVSALNCGAMFFMGFAGVALANGLTWRRAACLCLCLAAFFAPVLVFLWPSLSQNANFDQHQFAIFQQLFELRWHKDYSGSLKTFFHFFSPFASPFPILSGGVLGWLAIYRRGSQRTKILCLACPWMAAGLLLTALFCWLETNFAPNFGRLPMGHELVRGMRFFIPICWLLVCGGFAALCGKWALRLLAVAAFCALFFIAPDRQLVCAEYALRQLTGLSLPLSATGAKQAQAAQEMYKMFEEISKIVPEGQAVYCPVDAMQLRYISLRPLIHSFKDGYMHFYNKDPDGSRKWLELEQLARARPDGWLDAWQKSGAPWILLPPENDKDMTAYCSKILDMKNGWRLGYIK